MVLNFHAGLQNFAGSAHIDLRYSRNRPISTDAMNRKSEISIAENPNTRKRVADLMQSFTARHFFPVVALILKFELRPIFAERFVFLKLKPLRFSIRIAGWIFAIGTLLACAPADAAILGTNPPARALTVKLIDELPKDQQSAWREYLAHSQQQREADQDFLRQEMRAHQLKRPLMPVESRSRKWAGFNRADEWYRGADARQIADCILSFQTPAGGWSKNMNMASDPRAPGMLFAPDNASRYLGNSDFDIPLNQGWSYVGTFDNNATTLQLRFLAKFISANTNEMTRYRNAFQRGANYIFAAQYPNGGWPQVWPLSGGYHDAITFNDGAFVNVLELVNDLRHGTNEFGFVSSETRVAAEKSFQLAMKCLLASQVIVDGRRTIWPQQCDVFTLQPTSARNYEMPSLASGESAGILLFLMEIRDPNPQIMTAIRDGVEWFRKNEIQNMAFTTRGNDGRHLSAAPGKGPIWARYYEVGTNRPLFGDRDKTIHDTVEEISKERRSGYSWFGDGGKQVLQQYEKWQKKHGEERD